MLIKFFSIAFSDLKKGIDPLRIFKKSWARFKKHGFNGMYIRLENEYMKINPEYIPKKKIINNINKQYANWIKKNEKFEVKYLNYKPLVSIIMPVYNSEFLEESIVSVLEQKYDNWELCIADDASENKKVKKILKKYENYEKIKIIYRNKNGHISEASNSALSIAKGEYVTFLDHDDLLSPYALYEVVSVINKNPDVKLIYSDEDKIDKNLRRFSPFFKPDWNPDMFFSQNYIAHLCVIKKDLIDSVGGFRSGYEGSQDYDLFLRCIEKIDEKDIVHIPKILYHWRVHKNSTSLNIENKSYVRKASVKALQDYFDRNEKNVIVLEGIIPNTLKPNYILPGIPRKEQIKPFIEYSKINSEIYKTISNGTYNAQMPFISIIIPTKDKKEYLEKCLDSLLSKSIYGKFEIIIINNNSTEKKTFDYFKFLKTNYSFIKILDYDKPFNYSEINNFAVTHAKGDIFVFMNNDVEIISDYWITELIQHNLREEIGVVGAKLYYPNDTIQHAGVILGIGIGGVAGHSHKYIQRNKSGYFGSLKIIRNVSAVTGALMSVRKDVFYKVGGFDEKLAVAFNDIDFCLKVMRAGYRNLWTPYVEAYHYESLTRGKEETPQKQKRFLTEVEYMKNKWSNELSYDNYFNINFCKSSEDFRLKV